MEKVSRFDRMHLLKQKGVHFFCHGGAFLLLGGCKFDYCASLFSSFDSKVIIVCTTECLLLSQSEPSFQLATSASILRCTEVVSNISLM